jgi:hypothetical protein
VVAATLYRVDQELERLARQCHALQAEAGIEAHRTTLRPADGIALRI